MNAYELADALDVESSQAEYGYVVDDWKLFSDSANMLRQQAQEKAALSDRIKDLTNWKVNACYRIAELERKAKAFEQSCRVATTQIKALQEELHWLTNNPLQELSDEEILKTCIKFGFYDRISDPHFDDKTGAWSLDEDLIQFARAILKKASEK